MKCKHHPFADASATCEVCNTSICGVCSNYTAKGVYCHKCVGAATLAERRPAGGKVAAAPKSIRPASSMDKLLEEGKDLQVEALPDAENKRKERSKFWDLMHITGIVACVVFLGARYFLGSAVVLDSTEIMREEQSRMQLENCMVIFWEISDALKNNEEPDPFMSCAEAGGPNIIARVNGDIIVHHPRPDMYGYADIFVSKNNPIPVLVDLQ